MADYRVEYPVAPDVVAKLIEEGKAFLAAATRYLDEHPGSAEGGGRGDG